MAGMSERHGGPVGGNAAPPVEEAGSRAERRRAQLLLALVLAATFATYAVCLGQYFFLDDFWHLDYSWNTPVRDVWRPWVYSWEDDKSYWFAASRPLQSRAEAFFRPLVSVLYAVGLRLWGANPAAFHAVSVAAHLAATAFFFWLAWRLFRRAWSAGFAAAVFGLHPGQVEAVQWIAANADALLALTGICCVASFVEADRRRPGGKGFYALSLVSFVLALGAKEMAVTLPLVLLGYQILLARQGSGWRRVLRERWGWHAPFWALSLGYALWRLPTVAGVYSLHPGGNYLAGIHSALFYPQLVLNFSYYLLHFFVPYPIFPISFRELLGVHCWWIALLCAAAIALAALPIARGEGEERRILRFGAFWVAATILPFSFVDPAQRLVHLPSAGFALAAGAAGALLARSASLRRRWLPAGAVALLALYAAVSFSYASGFGFVANRVETIARGLDREMETLPPGTEIYLIDLWQPAWMFEHLFAVTRPDRRDEIHVLTLDPEVIPPDLRGRSGLLGRWFTAQFGDTGDVPPVSLDWELPRALTLRRERGGYLSGVVDRILDVAPQATDPSRVVDAGGFTGRSVRMGPEGVTELSFRWKEAPEGPARSFFLWQGDRWERLTPPTGWDPPAPAASLPAR